MKPSIVSRYLTREVGAALFAVTLVLLGVLLSTRLIRYLAAAASGEIPVNMIMTLLGYRVVRHMSLILPASYFLGIVLALGRLYRDSEMAALAATGFGPRELYRALMGVALPLTALVAVLSFWAGPWAAHRSDLLEAKAKQNVDIRALRAGRFLHSQRANGMFYVEHIDQAHTRLRDVFVETVQKGKHILIAAKSARLEDDAESGARYLVFLDGYRYQGVPGQGNWQVVRFKRHGILIREPAVTHYNPSHDAIPTSVLLKTKKPEQKAELQWRFAMPIMTLVLMLIAVPLSRSSPRDGRYGKMLAAVLVYVAYSNGLTVSRQLVSDGQMPAWVGLWWVHVAAILFGLAWLLKQYGWPHRVGRGESGA